MRVLCMVPHPTISASTRLRIEQYVDPLRELGIELHISRFLDETGYVVQYRAGSLVGKALAALRGFARRLRDLARARRYDVVVVHREATLIGPPFVERSLRLLGVPYVYDFDDAIFEVAPYAVNRRWAWLRPTGRIATIARGASTVIVGNAYLAAWAKGHNDHVVILPTPVDTVRHRPVSRRVRQPVVIGWVGSPTTAPYLALIDEALRLVAREHDIVVRVIGGRYENPGVVVELLPYDMAAEPEQVAAFDIGILPEPDDQWTRGKGAFKALVYMASGLPVVASRVGVNADVVEHGVSGFCVDGTGAWADALARLVADPDLRRRMGEAGRRRAEERFALEVFAPRFAAILRGVLASHSSQ